MFSRNNLTSNSLFRFDLSLSSKSCPHWVVVSVSLAISEHLRSTGQLQHIGAWHVYDNHSSRVGLTGQIHLHQMTPILTNQYLRHCDLVQSVVRFLRIRVRHLLASFQPARRRAVKVVWLLKDPHQNICSNTSPCAVAGQINMLRDKIDVSGRYMT